MSAGCRLGIADRKSWGIRSPSPNTDSKKFLSPDILHQGKGKGMPKKQKTNNLQWVMSGLEAGMNQDL